MFGLLGSAFGLGQSLAGLSAPRLAKEVTSAENAFNDRVADITARRVAKESRYQIGAQRLQIGATGGGFTGSVLFVAADDARKTRQRISNVYLQNEAQKSANTVGNPTRAGAASNALASGADLASRIAAMRLF